jgi:hypothetical protein
MPMINDENLTQATDAFTNQGFKSNQSTNSFNAQATNNFNQPNQNQKGLFHIPEKYLQLIP